MAYYNRPSMSCCSEKLTSLENRISAVERKRYDDLFSKYESLHEEIDDINETTLQKYAELESKWNELTNGREYVLSGALQSYLSDKYGKNVEPILDDESSLEDLSRNLCSLLENSQFTDVVIKCGDKVYEAHKCILCSRSSVFETMFNCQMQESKDSTVVINDLEPGVVHKLLKFMYCGQMKDLDNQTAYDLVNAAEKYQVKALKNTCVNFLKSNITVENAAQTLVCGDMYDSDLKAFALNFMCKEIKALRSQESWKHLQVNSPTLALEVYNQAFDKIL